MIKKLDLLQGNIDMETLFESMPVAMALTDREGRLLLVNHKMALLSGQNLSDLIGRKVEEVSKEAAENIKYEFRMFDAGLDVPNRELKIGDKICYTSVKPVRDNDGLAVGVMAALTDITKQKKIERQLAEANKQLKLLADHDSLTNLLNARAYYEVCERMMSIALRHNKPFSVLFVDLDHFKKINDTHGHHVGDLLLKAVSACILETCRDSDLIGRVGGEEFSLFLPETGMSGAMIFAEKLRSNIEQLLHPVGTDKNIGITASIGVASKLIHHKAIVDIQRDADHAMYHAKHKGRNQVSCLSVALCRT
ncbi:diguanylate cyclase with PAS/PAC sensor [Psychromonas ingrahamii 37]|uniref:diguanylate cyclase n=1 Tax=Psychromonas ingrahamii (strain DSM 17664 / CCUG 51855 / 37) TaxID=357804 RepID=A1SU72_PSYIN|nr:sensor domain-containing diguanylate cyclase [Psychromonas ingrahamii]ABM03037.1 diguanylate cyclase with PAS/PAC sensor [Psychromonas ingrahamii 37]